jgi:5-formyltetrahydrofolate cyclo-ligase
MTTKAEIRAVLRARRKAHVARLRAEGCYEPALAALAARVLTRLDGARTLAAYLPHGAEIDPLPILAAAAARGLITALPRITSRAEPMQFHRWAPGDPLFTGLYGLRQPAADAPIVTPDLILTPLVGFDRALARIGQGAAFYDRAFARYPAARRIGLAWSAQEADALPVDPWDVPLHAIATETEWITPQ